MGHIVYFHIEEWSKAMEYKHIIGITKINADPAGTRLIFIDSKIKGYLFNGVCIKYMIICVQERAQFIYLRENL